MRSVNFAKRGLYSGCHPGERSPRRAILVDMRLHVSRASVRWSAGAECGAFIQKFVSDVFVIAAAGRWRSGVF